jgi:hypothetical protein
MTVTKTNTHFINKCIKCNHKWKAIVSVSIINFDTSTSTVYPKEVHCPSCFQMSKINKVNDKNE